MQPNLTSLSYPNSRKLFEVFEIRHEEMNSQVQFVAIDVSP